MNFDDSLLCSTAFYSIFAQPLKLMIMEIVNIEANAFMEMNNILWLTGKSMGAKLNCLPLPPYFSQWADKIHSTPTFQNPTPTF